MSRTTALGLAVFLTGCGGGETPPEGPADASSVQEPVTATFDEELVGDWTVTMIQLLDGATFRAPDESPPSLTFTSEPEDRSFRFSGTTGCVPLEGSYRFDSAGGLVIAGAPGEMADDCSPEALELSDMVSAGLSSAGDYTVNGSNLTISFDDGSILAVARD